MYTLTQPWYEKKLMVRKEVEDVIGGKDAWANVDKTEGMYQNVMSMLRAEMFL